MDIQYYGGNCLVVTVKGTRIVIDDNLKALGTKGVLKAGDVALFTGPTIEAASDSPADAKLIFDMPGEYEVADISITGIGARLHLDENGKNGTMFKIATNETSLLVTGHIYPELSEKQLEAIGLVDVMALPVGGHGYTLDAIGALKIIKAVEPKLVIPTHYDDKSLKYEVPQTDLTSALHDMAMEPKETTAKLKIKPAELSDLTQLIVLEKS